MSRVRVREKKDGRRHTKPDFLREFGFLQHLPQKLLKKVFSLFIKWNFCIYSKEDQYHHIITQ
jgi:hypothetical protein